MRVKKDGPLFQPPEEVLKRKDSVDVIEPPKSAVVKTVEVTLAAALAFGAIAPAAHTAMKLSEAKDIE